jgi:hypothetical protein
MLSAIAQRLTGERLIQYLEPRLFVPIGIANPTWEQSPEGIDVGGWGLTITTLDIARFGQLYLQRGAWQGRQLLPAAWVAEATSRQVPNGPSANPDWEQGYGYQFWRCRHDAYRGDGAFGQFCVVMPDQDVVLAITSGVQNMQAVLDLVWTHLLPAFGASDLAANPAAQQAMSDRLAGLRLTPTAGQPVALRASEVFGREFEFEDNPLNLSSIRFDLAGDSTTLTIRGRDDEQLIPCGYGRWLKSQGSVLAPRGTFGNGKALAQVAASGAWKDERSYVIDLCWPETPFCRTLTCAFDGDQVIIDQRANVSFVATELPSLVGQATAKAAT